jgi:hypothetical protein
MQRYAAPESPLTERAGSIVQRTQLEANASLIGRV